MAKDKKQKEIRTKNAKDKKQKTLILLDAHAIIHRAYHALPDFTSGTGEPTGALYGLSAMLIKLIRELSPDYIVACYDLPKPTFRHAIYKEYKGKRPKLDNELAAQITRSRDTLKAFTISIYEKEGFEADDIIGTIVHSTKNDKTLRVIIASGDMDTLQLVDDKKVQVYTLRKGLSDTILYDEARVIERFGFKPEFLPDYKGLRGDPSDNIIGITGIGEKTAGILIKTFGTLESMYGALKKGKEAFYKAGLSDRIITLLQDGKEEAFFSKVLAQIRLDAPIEFHIPKSSWKEEAEKEKITAHFQELGFRSLASRIEEIFPKSDTDTIPEKPKEEVLPEDLEKIGIALWLLDSNISNPTLADILDYAKTESFVDASKKILSDLEKNNLKEIHVDIELPLIPVLKKAEQKGIRIDAVFLKTLSETYHIQLEKLARDIWKDAGQEFNINSPKQLGEILFEKLNLAVKVKRTGTGAKSTRASELEKLQGAHPIIDKILDYREFQKLLSTYIDNIPHMLGDDGRLHTHFVQTGAATGRLSSQNPNLQNIPIRTELGRVIRKAFIAEKGYRIVSFDYSQVELRIAALLSGDKKLKKIFLDGKDVHTATAAEIYTVPIEQVTADMRRAAKVINFGILYGMGVTALRQNLNTTREEAQKFYNNYFSTFKTLAQYLDKTVEDAREKGYTETYFGRKRFFPGLNSPYQYIQAQEERMALNAPIQGTQADMIKIAMARIEKRLEKERLLTESHLVLQIHDELVYEVKEDIVKKVAGIVKDEMENVLTADISFTVGVSEGGSWGDMKRLETI